MTYTATPANTGDLFHNKQAYSGLASPAIFSSYLQKKKETKLKMYDLLSAFPDKDALLKLGLFLNERIAPWRANLSFKSRSTKGRPKKKEKEKKLINLILLQVSLFKEDQTSKSESHR